MSELLDKELNAQKESLKNVRGSRKLLHAHKKVCDENERKKQEKNGEYYSPERYGTECLVL